jgi:hypothetical protein
MGEGVVHFPLALLRRSGFAKAQGETGKGVKNKKSMFLWQK